MQATQSGQAMRPAQLMVSSQLARSAHGHEAGAVHDVVAGLEVGAHHGDFLCMQSERAMGSAQPVVPAPFVSLAELAQIRRCAHAMRSSMVVPFVGGYSGGTAREVVGTGHPVGAGHEVGARHEFVVPSTGRRSA